MSRIGDTETTRPLHELWLPALPRKNPTASIITRQSTSREVLVSLLDGLSVHALDRDTILVEVGYAPGGKMTGTDRPDPEHSFEEAIKEITSVEWPSVIANEAMDVLAANEVAQRLWGVDLPSEFSLPVERNMLARMSNPRVADQMANWDEAVCLLLTLVKGSYGDVAEESERDKYYRAVMAHFLAGEPRYVQAAMRMWLEAKPQILKWRFRYPLHWRHPEHGVIRFNVVVNPVNRRERLHINGGRRRGAARPVRRCCRV